MKKLLLFLLLAAASFAGAQSTNEPSFKHMEDERLDRSAAERVNGRVVGGYPNPPRRIWLN